MPDRRVLVGLWLAAMLTVRALGGQGAHPEITLATTTSVRDAGLLEVVLPRFEHVTGYRVRVIAVGTGQALTLGRRGEADLLLVHDAEAEQQFVAEGAGIDRVPVMQNGFVLVGPPDDPADVRGLSIEAALRRIAEPAGAAVFVSRGDGSGTHAREQWLWHRVGGTPGPDRYRETGQGMSATLQAAHELGAYTLSDLGTFLAGRDRRRLNVLVDGDSLLRNPYHILPVNPERFPWINAEGAAALVAFLTGPEGRAIIAAFGAPEFGRPLFAPIP